MALKTKEKYSGITIRARPERGTWRVCWPKVDGKRTFKDCASKAEARGVVDLYLAERERFGMVGHGLTADQRLAAVKAVEMLKSTGGDLAAAAAFYAQHHSNAAGQQTVGQFLETYLADKKTAGRRHHTIADARRRCSMFAADYGARGVQTITTHDIEQFLERWPGDTQPTNRLNYRTALVAFFNHAIEKKLRADNPAQAVPRPTLDLPMPEIFTVAEVERLLLATGDIYPRLIPPIALGLFAGLRPSEAEKTDWAQVDFTGKTVRVLPEVAKRRRTRIVDMSDNLVAWLLPHRKPTDKLGVPYCVFRRYAARIMAKAKITRWPPDVLRHCYASAHFAMHESADKTAAQLGHLNAKLLYDHYRGLMSKKDAVRYWKIFSVGDNVINMPAAAS